ncbi:MAG: hypothetical protein KDA45_04890 [Planctomycetales bacterium]|nr:hypothetical protein [Planctomycetales bacterium]
MAIVLPKLPSRRLSPRRNVAVRTEPALGLRLLSLQQGLEPGETLEFEYCLKRVSAEMIDHLELSVMWCTEGKGSEDLGVHLFESVSAEQLLSQPLAGCATLRGTRRVATVLPSYPLSYEGRLMKIRWCIRLRLYLADGREITAEQPFYLGHLTLEV